MTYTRIACSALAAAILLAGPVSPGFAKEKKTYEMVNPDAGVPVFPYDITDRPYTVLGEVKAGVRKATIFSKEASQAKIYRELWERAEKLNADAVVNAKYGESHVTAFSWGTTNATGTAIKFTGPATPKAPDAAADAAAKAADDAGKAAADVAAAAADAAKSETTPPKQ